MVVQNARATEAFEPRLSVVRNMVRDGITHLAGKSTSAEAWLSLVSTQDIVGIKVFSAPGANSGTRPAVVAAVVEELLNAGLPPEQVIVWDKLKADLRAAGFYDLGRRYGIRVQAAAEIGYDRQRFYETPLIGQLIFGDLEFGEEGEGIGRKSFVTKLVTREITKLINVTPLLNHNSAGVSGNLYSLTMGSVDNVLRFEPDPKRLATAVPEIYALPILGDRVVLNIVDALVGQYEGEQRSLLHYSKVLNELWLSKDPVALDVLALRELDRERSAAKMRAVANNLELYQNASLLEIGVSDPQNIHVERVD